MKATSLISLLPLISFNKIGFEDAKKVNKVDWNSNAIDGSSTVALREEQVQELFAEGFSEGRCLYFFTNYLVAVSEDSSD